MLTGAGAGLISLLLLALLVWAAFRHWTSGGHQSEPEYAGYFRLMDDIEANDLRAVSQELDRGTDPNLIPPCDEWEQDFAPLSAAAGDGHLAMVRLLLRRGADPNLADGWNYNPLTAAAVGNHVDVMRVLIQSGAWVQEDHFSIALWRAAVEGKKEAVAFLLAHGADPDQRGDDGKSLRQALRELGNAKMEAVLPPRKEKPARSEP